MASLSRGWGASPALDQYLSGRDNNLNAIRMVAATAVLVSHSFPITLGEGAEEPLARLTGLTLGSHAVVVFFILSGLLIARSFDRGQDLWRFALARAARLYPALIVVVSLTVLLGALFTTLPLDQYFAAPATLSYVPRNLSLAFLQYPLPGVFEENPLPGAINGSLWTLFYEVICYAGVVGFGLVGLLRRRVALTLVVSMIGFAFVLVELWEPVGGIQYRAERLLTLGFPFALGMLVYVWREVLRLDVRVALALWVLPVLLNDTIMLQLSITIALAYSIVCLGFLPRGKVLHYNRLGDYSYGTYLYAFPVQQTLAHLLPSLSPLAHILLALPTTLLLAVLSWHLVEGPALGRLRGAGPRSAKPIATPDLSHRADLL